MRRWQQVVWTAGLLGAGLWLAPATYTQESSCFAVTGGGNVQGLDNGASCAFLGIPFAAPPIGPLRWRAPQPASPWAPVTLNVVTAPSNCALINPPSPVQIGSEDCLRLNIWTPDPAPLTPAPVIVWIHPGAFIAASANLPAQNGRALAERTGAIVVAANYRLGAFGFLAHPALTHEDTSYPSSGNYGLMDQRAALAWVRDNIAGFGGDPNNVTIAGGSSGAHSVSLHLVSPRSEGYFHKAIMQSGYASSLWPTLEESEAVGLQFAVALGCTTPGDELSCLRSKSRSEVLVALPTGQQQVLENGRVAWSPNVDGLEVPDQPRSLYERGSFSHVPVIVGATRDEGWLYVDRSFPSGLTEEQYASAVETEFGEADAAAILARYPVAQFASPKHALARLAGDFEAVCEARRVAKLITSTGTPVYFYSFEYAVAPVAGTQVVHGIDTNFVFGNNYAPPTSYVLNPDDRVLANAIGDYWTRFAATGNPNGGTALAWHQFVSPTSEARGAQKYLILDRPLRDEKRLREEQCDFWEPYFLRSVVGAVPARR